MKSVCFIPVFNQVEELPRVLAELQSTKIPVDEILFINNGSNDGSEKLVHSSGYPYIDVPRNRGIGYSFMVAADWALKRDFEIFAVIASNGKMLPQEMSRVIDPIKSGKAEYVTGSRFLPGGSFPNTPTFRRLAIPMLSFFVKFLTGHFITDVTCGYKAFKLELLRRAKFDWHAPWLETYGFEYYLYGKVLRSQDVRWQEVPITMRYPEKGKSYTKMKSFISWWHMMKPWIVSRYDRKGGFSLPSSVHDRN